MIVRVYPPDQFAGESFNRVDIAEQITEVKQRRSGRIFSGFFRRRCRHHDTGTHVGTGVEGPPYTSGFPIQRVDRAIRATREHRARCKEWMRARASCIRERKRPLQFKPRKLRRAEACALATDLTQVAITKPPTRHFRWRPAIEAQAIEAQPIDSTPWQLRFDLGGDKFLAGKVLGHLLFLQVRECSCLGLHDATGQRAIDGTRGQEPQHAWVWRTSHALVMTCGAVLLIDRVTRCIRIKTTQAKPYHLGATFRDRLNRLSCTAQNRHHQSEQQPTPHPSAHTLPLLKDFGSIPRGSRRSEACLRGEAWEVPITLHLGNPPQGARKLIQRSYRGAST